MTFMEGIVSATTFSRTPWCAFRSKPERSSGIATHPPRCLGLRHARSPDPAGYQRQRTANQGVVQELTKQAFAYVFDCVTGQPVWPMEERPVPRSQTFPAERNAATQPFPTKPPAFDVQGITTDDLIDFTPQMRAKAIEAIQQFRTGPIYTRDRSARRRVEREARFPFPVSEAAPIGNRAQPIRKQDSFTSVLSPGLGDCVDPAAAQHPDGELCQRRWPGSSRIDGLPLLKPPYVASRRRHEQRRNRLADRQWRHAARHQE